MPVNIQYHDLEVKFNPWAKEFLPGGAKFEDPDIKALNAKLNHWLDSVGITDERFAAVFHEGFWHVWIYPKTHPHCAFPRYTARHPETRQPMQINEYFIANYILPDGPWANLSIIEKKRRLENWNALYEKRANAALDDEKGALAEKTASFASAHQGTPAHREHLRNRGEFVAMSVPADLINDTPEAPSTPPNDDDSAFLGGLDAASPSE